MAIERTAADQKAITERITGELRKSNVDAVLLTAADAVFYATGFADRGLYRGGALGNAAAVVTKDGKVGLVISEFSRHAAEETVKNVDIASYPTWIYIADYDNGKPKEVQPDLNKTYRLALQFLPETSKNPRIAVQWQYLTYSAGEFLKSQFGENSLVSADKILVEARAIKTSYEIALLREAAHYSELTMNRVAKAVVPGMTAADVTQLFNSIAYSFSSDVDAVSNAHTIGAHFTPYFIWPQARVNRGDLIRLDGGPNVRGYNSDLARTFAVGTETKKEWEELYAHLWAGYDYAIHHIGPGVKFSDIFNGIHEVLKKRGFEGYIRGHQGHSLGCALAGEEYPFIAPGEHRVFEPGMVINIEMPYYSSKNQTYNIEDTMLITEDGIELFTHASPSLYV